MDIFSHLDNANRKDSQPADVFEHLFAPAPAPAAAAPAPSSTPADNSPFVDFASSLGTGMAKGLIGAAGLPRLLQQGLEYARPAGTHTGVKLPTSADLIAGASEYIPALKEKPSGVAGQYGEAIGEFVPLAGGGARNLLTFGVAPGAVSEAAGQATKGSSVEPYARLAGALAGGGGAASLSALASRPSVAERAVSGAVRAMSPEDIARTEEIFARGQGMGVPVTRAEAAQQATGGATNLGNLQRVVEGNGGLQDFMARRPAQIDAAGRQFFDTVAPATDQPSMIGPQIGEAAGSVVSDVQAAINRRSRPLYQNAEQFRVDPQDWQTLSSDPLFSSVLREVRGDPALNRTIANAPDDSVAVIDLVQRRMRERADIAQTPGQASTSNLAAANLGDARGQSIAAANLATGSRPAQGATPATIGAYEQARGLQDTLRETYLAPLMNGPIGKLAEKDITTRNAVNALFPQSPVPGSANEVLTAVQALSKRNPMASRRLVRAHIEGTFNQATRDLQSGMNQFGGATFRAKLVGNEQQAANLAAAITGLPNGAEVLKGFDSLMEIMATTGQRQRIGSQTAFNTEVNAALKEGRVLGDVLPTGGIKLPQVVREKLQAWNLGKNTDQIAKILTDPKGAETFRRLATAKPGSSQAIGAVAKLVYLSNQASNKKDRR